MDKPKRRTAEAIEAAISAYAAWHQSEIFNEESREFIRIMSSNERLKSEIINALHFITDLEVPMELQSEVTKLDMVLLKVTQFCALFFWVGWYARGAVEDAEQLKRMTE